MSEAGLEDVVVIGGGITGLHAAMTVAEDGWRVRLVDAMGGGGQLLNLGPLASYPSGASKDDSGPDLAGQLLEQAMEGGVELSFGSVSRLTDTTPFRVDTDAGELLARVVVIATGQSAGQLGLPGETDLVGRGISHCASCDGPLFANKAVCVVGDGEWAVDEALHLAEYASRVTLIVPSAALRCGRRRPGLLGATEKIEIVLDAVPTALTSRDGLLQSVAVEGVGGGRTIPTDGLFPITGWRPNTEFVPDTVACRLDGNLAVDRFGATTLPNLFAAGDVTRSSPGTLLEAAAAGVTTGMAVNRLLASAKDAPGSALP